jgi:hypothetical protein
MRTDLTSELCVAAQGLRVDRLDGPVMGAVGRNMKASEAAGGRRR